MSRGPGVGFTMVGFSVEGQADTFAAKNCMARFFKSDYGKSLPVITEGIDETIS